MRAIFFDLDGTLLHFTRDYGDVLSDAIRAVEGEVRDEWLETYSETFFELLDECGSDPYRRAFAAVGDDPEALAAALREREVEACEPPEGVRSDLARLSDEYELGVLTNGVREWQRHKLRAHDLEGYFDAVVTSYDAEAPKPDPAPFRLAEERLPADEYVMVGDDEADIEGARRAGWSSYEYRGQGFGDLPDDLAWE